MLTNYYFFYTDVHSIQTIAWIDEKKVSKMQSVRNVYVMQEEMFCYFKKQQQSLFPE